MSAERDITMNLLMKMFPETAGAMTFERLPDGRVNMTRRSVLSGRQNSMILDASDEQLNRYFNNNELIQNVFPNLNADEREFILTGSTPEEWNNAFPEEDE